MSIQKYPWLTSFINQYPPHKFPTCLVIEGESGLAKSQLASYFSKQLLCLNSSKICEGCNSCSYLEAESHPDYCYLDSITCSSALHALSKKKKEDLVSKRIHGVLALNDFMSRTNSVSLRRVGVIFDAHTMNLNAQNALLKTLEELPENKFIILVSNKRKYFLPTIYSRSAILSVNNPPAEILDVWIKQQGYIDHSTLDFAPDSTPLEIESLIKTDSIGQYQEITKQLDSYCSGKIDTSDLIKFLKDLNLSYEAKINSLIIFLKTCLGIITGYSKPHPLIPSMTDSSVDQRVISDLIEEMIDYKVSLGKVPSLNEQIGLSYFIFKLKNIFIF